MLVGKNLDYKGPKTYRSIVKNINQEEKEKRNNISCKKIYRILGLYFGKANGVGRYIRKGRVFYLLTLGMIRHDPIFVGNLHILNMRRKIKINRDKMLWKLVHIKGLSREEANKKLDDSKKYWNVPKR